MKESGPAYDENIFGGMSFDWKLRDKYATSKKFVDNYWKKYGKPQSKTANRVMWLPMRSSWPLKRPEQ